MFALTYGTVYRDPTNGFTPADLRTDLDYPNFNCLDYKKRVDKHELRMEQAWEGIAQNEKKHIVLGTNKICGPSWCSSLWGFEQVDELTIDKSCFRAKYKSLISKLRFITNNILLVAFRSGSLQLWSTYSEVRNTVNPYCLFLINEKHEHLQPIVAMETMKSNTNKAATGCKNGMLKIWDMSAADLTSLNTFRFAHSDVITAVDTSYTDEAILATCSLDKSALIWDNRLSVPASELIDCHSARLKHIAWAPASTADNLIYLGDEIGFVHSIDKRVPNKFISSTQYFHEVPIRKILPECDKLAVIADSHVVKIAEAGQHKVVYENKESKNFIRDCIWRESNKLLTIGLDSKLRIHNIS